MAKFKHLQCPDCLGTWKWLQHPSDEPLPDFCPRCGSNLTAEPVFVPEAAHIAKTIGRTADQVYRQMEASSRDNMQAAAELTGDDVADYRAMQITDMPDYLRDGDVAAKMPLANNVVAQALSAGRGGFGPGLAGMTGAEYAANTAEGAFPRAGDATRQALTATHTGRARAVESTGLGYGSSGRRRTTS